MRILLVSHNYPPAHSAGTEIYTAELARKLVARGHEVEVFTTEKEISAPHLSLRRRTHQGIVVHELVNNLHYESFRETWDEPRIDARFGEVLASVAPDVVHFQHLLYLSIGCVGEARRRRIPVVFTLHDYWLTCARFGQRVHVDGSICATIDFARCGDCLAGFKFGQSGLERRAGEALAGLRGATGIDLGRAAVRVSRLLQGRGAAAPEVSNSAAPGGEPGPRPTAPKQAEAARRMAEEVVLRDRDMRERLLPQVDRFFSPSRFLRDEFVRWGIEPERITFLRTGIDLEHFRPLPRRRHGKLRIAFLGTLAPHKAPHLLLEAWALVEPRLRAAGRVSIHGPGRHHPEYVRELEARADELGVELAGPLPRERVAEVLAETDLLVVPSIWFENSPLVILEALAARTPLAVSDIGGMAELVEEGVHGFRFPVGDAVALAARLSALLADSTPLERLYPGDEVVKRVDDDAAQLEECYFQALERARRSEAGS